MKVIDVSALATATADATPTDDAAATPTGATVVNAASSKTIAGGASLMAVLLAIMMV